ncbi:MAG: hypothetical protein JXQ73_25710 [Phycisphaerae bacterium]|nr:hypothetical protein [Phycisphaerae bacterium]
MLRTRARLTLTKLATASCACSVLMLLDSCDPEVRDVWLTGIETAAVGVVTALTSLLTTAVTAIVTGAGTTDGGTTTVQAVFEWASQVAC